MHVYMLMHTVRDSWVPTYLYSEGTKLPTGLSNGCHEAFTRHACISVLLPYESRARDWSCGWSVELSTLRFDGSLHLAASVAGTSPTKELLARERPV